MDSDESVCNISREESYFSGSITDSDDEELEVVTLTLGGGEELVLRKQSCGC